MCVSVGLCVCCALEQPDLSGLFFFLFGSFHKRVFLRLPSYISDEVLKRCVRSGKWTVLFSMEEDTDKNMLWVQFFFFFHKSVLNLGVLTLISIFILYINVRISTLISITNRSEDSYTSAPSQVQGSEFFSHSQDWWSEVKVKTW